MPLNKFSIYIDNKKIMVLNYKKQAIKVKLELFNFENKYRLAVCTTENEIDKKIRLINSTSIFEFLNYCK